METCYCGKRAVGKKNGQPLCNDHYYGTERKTGGAGIG
jgi:hypothetical protein